MKSIEKNDVILHIFSDVHIDCWLNFQNMQISSYYDLFKFDENYIKDNNVLCLYAGDSGNGARYWNYFNGVLAEVYGEENFISVKGNHDYYDDMSILINEDAEFHEKHGLKIGTATLWTSFWGSVDHIQNYSNTNCYSRILGLKSQLVHDVNRKQCEQLKNMGELDIVVTHFGPSKKSISDKYLTDVYNNPYFCDDNDQLVQDISPKLFVHGHTHSYCNYTIGNTRVICNPIGYPKENRDTFSISPVEYVIPR